PGLRLGAVPGAVDPDRERPRRPRPPARPDLGHDRLPHRPGGAANRPPARPGRAVSVAVAAHDGGALVEVTDDGVGFEPGVVAAGTGIATMQMFSNLGRGELTIRSAPGQGTAVRSLLHLRV